MYTIKRVVCGTVNCYLVSENGHAILIDTGMAGYEKKVLKECEHTNVRLIILTHGHCDHIQNTVFLSQKLQAPVGLMQEDIGLISNNLSQPLYAEYVLGRLVRFASLHLMKQIIKKEALPQFIPDIMLTDGMSLEQYGFEGKIIGLPGHTRGSLGVLLSQDIFVGDALMNMFYPTHSMIYTDEQQMYNSVKRIEQYKHITIHFGHGKPVKNRKWI